MVHQVERSGSSCLVENCGSLVGYPEIKLNIDIRILTIKFRAGSAPTAGGILSSVCDFRNHFVK